MMLRARSLALGMLLLITLACQRAAPPPAPARALPPSARASVEDIKRVVERYWDEYLVLNPTQGSSSGDRRFDAQLENSVSLQYLADSLALERHALSELRAIPATGLDQASTLTYEIFRFEREMAIQGFVFPQELLPVNPFEGMPQWFAQAGSGAGAQAFVDSKGYANWLRRIDGYVRWSKQAIENLRDGQRRGYTLPRAMVQRLLPQLAELAQARSGNVFFRPLQAFPASVSAADRARITPLLNAAIKDKLLPAYLELHDFLRNEYLPQARSSIGLSALPTGEAWYAYCVRRATTTAMTPTHIHTLGASEVERIRARLLDLAAQSGFAGNLPAFFEFLARDPRFYFQSAQEVLDAYGALKATTTGAAPSLFAVVPSMDMDIRPMEEFQQAGAPPAAYAPAGSGGRRGAVFYLNTADLAAHPRFVTAALFLHTGIPGRHFQAAIQQDRQDLPRFRRFGEIDAFVAGWSAYAESLGDDLGVNNDPYQRVGALISELRRSLRAVTDTGIHAKGWSRQQAVDYLHAQIPISDSQAGTEVDRIVALPGRVLADAIGEWRFKALRARAQAALGPRFDTPSFHSELLRDGSMPMDALDAKMDRWLKTKAYNPAQ